MGSKLSTNSNSPPKRSYNAFLKQLKADQKQARRDELIEQDLREEAKKRQQDREESDQTQLKNVLSDCQIDMDEGLLTQHCRREQVLLDRLEIRLALYKSLTNENEENKEEDKVEQKIVIIEREKMLAQTQLELAKQQVQAIRDAELARQQQQEQLFRQQQQQAQQARDQAIRDAELARQQQQAQQARDQAIRDAELARQQQQAQQERDQAARDAELARQRREAEQVRQQVEAERNARQTKKQQREEDMYEAFAELAFDIQAYIRTQKNFDCSKPFKYKHALNTLNTADFRDTLKQLRVKYPGNLPDTVVKCIELWAENEEHFVVHRRRRVSVRDLTPYQDDGRRVFGEYLCNCGRSWSSAGSWKDKFQNCKSCECEVYPYDQSLLQQSEHSDDDEIVTRPHDCARCQKCMEMGKLCLPLRYYAA